MKVLIAQDTFFPKVGGAEVHVWKLSRALIKRGHRVTVVTASRGPSVFDGLLVYRFPLLQTQGKRAIAALPFYLPKLIQLVRKNEIVHGHYTALCAAVLGMLARLLKRPFVVTLHGYGTLDSSVEGHFWLQLWRRLALHAACKVIATSSEMAEVARRFVPKERIVVIPNGVDTEEFIPSSNILSSSIVRIAAVRRLVPKNGVQYLIEAAPLIIRQSPKPVEFWIIGDGSLRQYLEVKVKTLGIVTQVKFFGSVPNERVRELLKQVDIVVFPSSAESTSIAALEAMSMGKPIVASNVGGYPELLGTNERGLLIELFDRTRSDYNAPLTLPGERLQILADSVCQLIREPELARILGERARTYVRQHFDWHVIAARVEQVYREVSEGCRPFPQHSAAARWGCT